MLRKSILPKELSEIASDKSKYLKLLTSKSSQYWKKNSEKAVLRLFNMMSKSVPAYKEILRKNKINPEKIKTTEDFRQLPILTKENYLTKFSLKDLSWEGDYIRSAKRISVSSGSSGEPFFWPRASYQENEGIAVHHALLSQYFKTRSKSTLYVVGFSMGSYVAGVYTSHSVIGMAAQGDRSTLVSPGLNQSEILRILSELGPLYDQVVLFGYPQFTKDVIDSGTNQGIDWKNLNLKLVFAGEGFSEEWRDYILGQICSSNYDDSAFNIYGTADATILAHETPLSIRLRRYLTTQKEMSLEFYGGLYEKFNYDPGLFQYNPLLRYFEATDGELIFSAFSGIPLCRYNIHDFGGVISFEKIVERVLERDNQELPDSNILKNLGSFWQLPFLYLYGKSDKTVVLYGLNIYQQNIQSALVHPDIASSLTGKFVMKVDHDEAKNQYLEIEVELRKGLRLEERLVVAIKIQILKSLRQNNLEYNKLYESIGTRADPRIKIVTNGGSNFSGKLIKPR